MLFSWCEFSALEKYLPPPPPKFPKKTPSQPLVPSSHPLGRPSPPGIFHKDRTPPASDHPPSPPLSRKKLKIPEASTEILSSLIAGSLILRNIYHLNAHAAWLRPSCLRWGTRQESGDGWPAEGPPEGERVLAHEIPELFDKFQAWEFTLCLRSRLPCTDPISSLRPEMGKNWQKHGYWPHREKGGKISEKMGQNGDFPIFRPFFPLVSRWGRILFWPFFLISGRGSVQGRSVFLRHALRTLDLGGSWGL